MITAKQTPYDIQESPFELYKDDLTGINIVGNRDYISIKSIEYETMENMLQDMYDDDTDKEILATVQEYFPEYNRENETLILKTIRAWRGMRDQDAALLTAITGDIWKTTTIYGTAQSEWQEVVYNTKEWTPEKIAILGQDYFNTGLEYCIYDDDGELTECMYIYNAYDGDSIKKKIAKSLDLDPSEIKLINFTGYTQVAQYEEV